MNLVDEDHSSSRCKCCCRFRMRFLCEIFSREGLGGPFLFEFWLRILLIHSFVFKSKMISEVLWQPDAVFWLWGLNEISALSFPPVGFPWQEAGSWAPCWLGQRAGVLQGGERLLGVCEENTLHLSSGAACHTADGNCPFAFFPGALPEKGMGAPPLLPERFP